MLLAQGDTDARSDNDEQGCQIGHGARDDERVEPRQRRRRRRGRRSSVRRAPRGVVSRAARGHQRGHQPQEVGTNHMEEDLGPFCAKQFNYEIVSECTY